MGELHEIVEEVLVADANCIGAARSGVPQRVGLMWISLRISPLSESGLDEAFGVAVGFGRIRLGADMLDAQVPASIAKVEGFVTTVVVGHDTGDGDTEAVVIDHGRLKERHRAFCLLVRQNLGEGNAGVIVDPDMNELPADTSTVTLTGAIAGDAVADLSKRPSFLMLMWIISPGLSRSLRRTGSAGSKSRIRFSPSRRRMQLTVAGDTPIGRDLLARVALAAFPDLGDYRKRILTAACRGPSTPLTRVILHGPIGVSEGSSRGCKHPAHPPSAFAPRCPETVAQDRRVREGVRRVALSAQIFDQSLPREKLMKSIELYGHHGGVAGTMGEEALPT
jgi:hypothetical protein